MHKTRASMAKKRSIGGSIANPTESLNAIPRRKPLDSMSNEQLNLPSVTTISNHSSSRAANYDPRKKLCASNSANISTKSSEPAVTIDFDSASAKVSNSNKTVTDRTKHILERKEYCRSKGYPLDKAIPKCRQFVRHDGPPSEGTGVYWNSYSPTAGNALVDPEDFDELPESQQSLNLSAEEELLPFKPLKKPLKAIPPSPNLTEFDNLTGSILTRFKPKEPRTEIAVTITTDMLAPKTPSHDSGIKTPTTGSSNEELFERSTSDTFSTSDDSLLVELTQQAEAQFISKSNVVITPRRNPSTSTATRATSTPTVPDHRVENVVESPELVFNGGPCCCSTPAVAGKNDKKASSTIPSNTPTSSVQKTSGQRGRTVRRVRANPKVKSVIPKSLRYEGNEEDECPPTQVCAAGRASKNNLMIMGDFDDDDNDDLFSQLEIPGDKAHLGRSEQEQSTDIINESDLFAMKSSFLNGVLRLEEEGLGITADGQSDLIGELLTQKIESSD